MVAKLSKEDFKNQVKDAKKKAKEGFNDFELGQYRFKLKAYEFRQDKSGGDQVIAKWTCISDEEAGKDFVKFFSLEKALVMLLQEWNQIGYDTDSMGETFEDLKKWAAHISKEAPTIIATLFMRKGYVSMKIDEVEAAETPVAASKPTATTTTAKPTVTTSKPVAAKAAPAVETVEDVSDVEEVTEDDGKQEVDINPGTKITFTWKGENKEGVVEAIEGDVFKTLAQNGDKKGRFSVKTEMITGVVA